MNTDLVKLLDTLASSGGLSAIAGLNIIVIGEAILECYLSGVADQCPEAPVPVVTVTNQKQIPGGAANTAVNVNNLGGRVTFLSVVGDDWEGALLRQVLHEYGLQTQHVLTHPGRQTLSKQRVIAADQILVKFDRGSTTPIDSETEQALIDELKRCFPECDAVIVSNYGYGILTERVIQALTKLQQSQPGVLVVDYKNITTHAHVGVTAAIASSTQERQETSSIGSLEAVEKYCPSPRWLVERVAAYRASGYRIVFTNGCFDILHAGHVSYLKRARSLGDILIIGVNSDASVSRLKGPSRPINFLSDRIQVLSALGCVDLLVAFDDDTPRNLIQVIRPDIYVKGGDYTKETLPEARLVEQLGGVVEILTFVENRSTTSIIERICKAYATIQPHAGASSPTPPGTQG